MNDINIEYTFCQSNHRPFARSNVAENSDVILSFVVTLHSMRQDTAARLVALRSTADCTEVISRPLLNLLLERPAPLSSAINCSATVMPVTCGVLGVYNWIVTRMNIFTCSCGEENVMVSQQHRLKKILRNAEVNIKMKDDTELFASTLD